MNLGTWLLDRAVIEPVTQSRGVCHETLQSASVQYLSQVIASSGNRLVHQTVNAIRIPGGITGTQQLTVNGVAQTPGVMGAEAFEFDYGPLVAPASLGAIDQTKQFQNVPGLGFQAPGGSGTTRSISCTWDFVL
jgi:hypothetical protein